MELIEVGQIVNTHGIKGEVKINPWVDDLFEFETFKNYYYKKNNEFIKLNKRSVRFHKNCAIIKFQEIPDLTEAEKYKGLVIFTERDENLPENVFYVKDLIGLTVLVDEKEFGTVCDVFKTGANDVYDVEAQDGKHIYVPAVKDFIKEINIEEKFIKINLVDGLVD